ncbi:hypothetical protein DFH27DRAFT_611749 [Peziza echinospora]|nr:hypothetical protein DFH27DRAFT_611749 [Peziza echinospora]
MSDRDMMEKAEAQQTVEAVVEEAVPATAMTNTETSTSTQTEAEMEEAASKPTGTPIADAEKAQVAASYAALAAAQTITIPPTKKDPPAPSPPSSSANTDLEAALPSGCACPTPTTFWARLTTPEPHRPDGALKKWYNTSRYSPLRRLILILFLAFICLSDPAAYPEDYDYVDEDLSDGTAYPPLRQTDPFRAADLHNKLLSLLAIPQWKDNTEMCSHHAWMAYGTDAIPVSTYIKSLPTFSELNQEGLDSRPNYFHLGTPPADQDEDSELSPDRVVRDVLSPALELFLDMIHVLPTTDAEETSPTGFKFDHAEGITPYATLPTISQFHEFYEWDFDGAYPYMLLLYPNSFNSEGRTTGGLFYDTETDLARWLDVVYGEFPSPGESDEVQDVQWRPLEDVLEEWIGNFVEGRWRVLRGGEVGWVGGETVEVEEGGYRMIDEAVESI